MVDGEEQRETQDKRHDKAVNSSAEEGGGMPGEKQKAGGIDILLVGPARAVQSCRGRISSDQELAWPVVGGCRRRACRYHSPVRRHPVLAYYVWAQRPTTGTRSRRLEKDQDGRGKRLVPLTSGHVVGP